MSVGGSKLVRDLTDERIHGAEALDRLRRFASEFGWRPSDQIDQYPGTERFCNGHLLIEHGFELSAVISFLHTDSPYADLSTAERRALLELSYNNLVDWHLLPERNGMRVVFNRTDPPRDEFYPISLADNVWRAEAFEKMTGRRPNPNVKALDDALISTISFWKRAIKTDFSNEVSLSQISSIINAVMLIRAYEDFKNRMHQSQNQLLTTVLDGLPQNQKTALNVIRASFERLGLSNLPLWLDEILQSISVFNDWDVESLRYFFGDFYRSKYSPYKYNFNLISKHALSRIYEHYVSVLRDNTNSDLTLFGDLPEELHKKDLGSIYTPQYIARFFARYLREQRTPRVFKTLRAIDPACGSGMFLRTLLEMQCDPIREDFSPEAVERCFSNTFGLDVDPSACQAARLSLALLHLVLTGKFPEELNIVSTEAIEWMSAHPEVKFDVIMANPPFVKWDGLSNPIRERLSQYMLNEGLGKQDLYLAFLKSAIDHTAPNGALCFVLPHSFLLSKSASNLRTQLSESFCIRILADLSEVPVFEQTGAYVILLIAERTNDRSAPATIVKCKEFVGAALQNALAGRIVPGDGFQVFEVDQKSFRKQRWNLVRAEESEFQSILDNQSNLDLFFDIRQGVITGADDIFIRALSEVNKSERSIWKLLLTDRSMVRYGVPKTSEEVVFMPFDKAGNKLSEATLKRDFPNTWKHLNRYKERLSNRSIVPNYKKEWWEPAWPRSPEKLCVPKLVTPHLVLLPRFGIDTEGAFVVSHSPYIVPKVSTGGSSILKILCAIMNSAIGHWQLSSTSHKYSKGYLMLEVKTLREFKIPDPAKISPPLTRKLVGMVDKLIKSPEEVQLVSELDKCVAEAYGLSEAQMKLVGVGA